MYISFSTLLALLLVSCTNLVYAMDSAKEYTLAIIKPNAVADNKIGAILNRLESSGLTVKALKMESLTSDQVKEFYREHAQRSFYNDLVQFMASGPVVLIVLEGPHAVAKNREVMGATNPAHAAPGTIRADFAKSLTQNAIHGSDSAESAKREVLFFFPAFQP